MKPEPKSTLASGKDFGSLPNGELGLPLDVPSVSSFPDVADHSNKKEKVAVPWANIQDKNSQVGTIRIIERDSILQQAAGVPEKAEAGTRVRNLDLPQARSPLSPAPTTLHASKHLGPEEDGITSERPWKRNRAILGSRYALDPESVQPQITTPNADKPPSPLFFSHSSRQRPLIPPNYSSSKSVARLPRARDEAKAITTLKLARGSISSNAASPPCPANSPGGWEPTEKSSTSRSLDSQGPPSGTRILNDIGIIELLEQDDRPTFIIDVANPANFDPGGPLISIFVNASLRACEAILDMVTGKEALDYPSIVHAFPGFKAWALSFVKNNESSDICLPPFSYGGLTWTCSTLRKQFRVIYGRGDGIITDIGSSSSSRVPSAPSVLSERPRGYYLDGPGVSSSGNSAEPTDYFGDALFEGGSSSNIPLQQPISSGLDVVNLRTPTQTAKDTHREILTSDSIISKHPDNGSFDWTRLPMSAALPKHIQFARSVDWATTPLGPIENWDFNLRAVSNLVMNSPHPAAMYWGDEYTAIYNEAYIMLAAQKHPRLMGQSYKVIWAEIWDDVENIFSSAKKSGLSTMKDDDLFFVKRNGYLEEAYFSWSIVPLVGDDGSVVGLYNPAFDKTRRKIAERRMLTLREIGDMAAAAYDVKSFWGQVIKGLEYNGYDVPFAFLYSVRNDSDIDIDFTHGSSVGQSPQCILEGTIGVPEGHKAAVSPLDLKTGREGFAPHLRESVKTGKPVFLTTEQGALSNDLMDGLVCRGFGDPCRAAVVCPIHPTTGKTILGFLVMGVNPRRPYDDDYSLFVQLLSRQLTTSMASVELFEEEIKRGHRAARLAALARQELSKQLDLRTREKIESETKFTRMAEFSTVGMFIANSKGQMTYCNSTWWEISQHPKTNTNGVDFWMDSVNDEDRGDVQRVWKTLVEGKTAVTHEFRFKSRNGNAGETWVLLNAYPEKDDAGQLKSISGSITNISSQKSAEDFQKRRMQEAIELKRQQENFIDMTSHEMRNPLSAILQCSDEISASLAKFSAAPEGLRLPEELKQALGDNIDAAQTIILCAQHQKRIVDDILTLSKLDSALLAVTPIKVQPVEVVRRALKMFEGELKTNDIAMEFRIEQSYIDLAVGEVKLDPSRLLQVLINLTTNAMKFTQTQEKRTIIVSIGASKERPSSSESGFTYFPSRSKARHTTANDIERGAGENVYLLFAVEDSGRGLDEDEKTLLFQRFRQTNPRTHVQYGGSGLGLFISRELTELQGGEIGVASERHVGSTFAFYIRARKVINGVEDTPPDDKMTSARGYFPQSAVALENMKDHYGKPISQSIAANQPSTQPASVPFMSPSMAPAVTALDRSRVRVLIVEDNLVNQRVLQKQLKNAGFATELANHGGEALAVLNNSCSWSGREKDGVDLALILLDLEMPVMDGLTTARKIRDLESEGTIVRHVPIIAVTANARLEQIETAISAGMDDFVSKPFRIQELIPKIEELVSKNAPKTLSLAI